MVLAGAVVAEIVLAVVLNSVRSLGLVHALLVASVAGYALVRRDLPLVITTCAYLTGSEVLWRQTRARIFYQFGPYLLIALSLYVVLVVFGRVSRDGRRALFYLGLMAPAVVATIKTTGPGSRELIAFALAGPAALAAFVAFTSQVVMARWLYRRVLWAVVISTLGPCAVAVSSLQSYLATSGSIEFRDQSNFITSGGFGPVQVSSVLGLGVMAAIILVMIEVDQGARILAALAGVALGVQSLLTFSRGGMFAVAISVSVLAVVQANNTQVRNRILVIVAVALSFGYLVVVPRLDSFTQGAFEERFSDPKSARTELAANDTEIFRRSLPFGVGPGMTKYQRLGWDTCQIRSDQCADEASSHTEFTRMLGEHGLPGLAAIALLGLLAVNAYRVSGRSRPLTVAWLAWAVAQMFYANLRVVAVAFAFGMAFVRIADAGDPVQERAGP